MSILTGSLSARIGYCRMKLNTYQQLAMELQQQGKQEEFQAMRKDVGLWVIEWNNLQEELRLNQSNVNNSASSPT